MRRLVITLLMLSAGSVPALTQPIYGPRTIAKTGSSPNPAVFPVGKSAVEVSVWFQLDGVAQSKDCGFSVSWGDGSPALNGTSVGGEISRLYKHTYTRTGQFTIQVDGTGTTACASGYTNKAQTLLVQGPSLSAVAAADAAAKSAERAAERAATGPTAAELQAAVRAAQLALDQRNSEYAKAESQLAAARNAAPPAALNFTRADSLLNICLAGPNRYPAGPWQYANFRRDCEMGAGWARAQNEDVAAKALVVTRTNELNAAKTAVGKAQGDLAKAKAAAQNPSR